MSEFKSGKRIKDLEEIFKRVGLPHEWLAKNSIVFQHAFNHKLSIGGSLGVIIGTSGGGINIKEPSDIDLVTDSVSDACCFISELATFLAEKDVFYTIKCLSLIHI